MTKSTGKPKFTISILAMNGLEMTRACIESVMKNSKNYELFLTDNGSDDGTLDYFKELSTAHPHIHTRFNLENLGFATPNNITLQEAKGKYFITLNNDTEVPKNWLRLLEEPFLTHETAAITGASGSPCSFQHPFPSFHGSLGANVEYIEGSCLCIKTSIAKEIGLFATYLHFAYGEDADLSLRARARGYTIHQVPFKIVHHRSKTSANIPNIEEIQHRNHEVLIKRWGKYLLYRKFDLPFVVRRNAAIGDVLLTTPLIAEIKRQNPQSEIFVETQFPELFRDNPNVAKAGSSFPHIYKWATEIDLDMSYENMPGTNILAAYYRTANILPSGDGGKLEIYPNEVELTAAGALLSGTAKVLAVHAGPTTWKGKNWPWPRWEQLCRDFMREGWEVLLVGTEGPSLPNHYDMRGRTNFQELAALLMHSVVFVGVDSFPMHVAAATDLPFVGLFGVSSPQFIVAPAHHNNFAFAVGSAPCAGERHRTHGKTFVDCDGACMESITVDQVTRAIHQVNK